MPARPAWAFLLVLSLLPLLAETASRAEEDLSVDARAFAWYAHGAAETGRKAAIPNLRRYLRDTSGEFEWTRHFARCCAVDALIRLEAVLPGEELALLLHSGLSDEGAVLAVRHATPAAALAAFESMDRENSGSSSEEWIAIGNRLAREKVPGAAARLLARFTTNLRIYVDDRVTPVSYRPPGGSVPGDGIHAIPDGFPPVPVYSLTTSSGRRCTLLSDGRRPIYVYRYTCEGRYGAGDVSGEPHRDTVRLEWVEDLLGAPAGSLKLRRFRCHSLVFTSERLFFREIDAARREAEDAFADVADRARSARILTAREREWLKPRIAVRFIDRRTRIYRTLPDLPASWKEPPLPDFETLEPEPEAPPPRKHRVR